jgi:hypothetical protein
MHTYTKAMMKLATIYPTIQLHQDTTGSMESSFSIPGTNDNTFVAN